MSSEIRKYSEGFKLQVIDDIESGRFCSPREASQAYGIPGDATIYRWIRKYGRNHLLKKVIRVEKANEPTELARQRERIRQLEALVADLSMDKALSDARLEILCEQQGIDLESFKKKAATSKSTRSAKKKGGK